MRKLLLIQSLLLFLFSVSFTGCVLDEEIDPNDSDPQAIFLGNWNVNDNETKVNYEVEIRRNPSNSTEVLLENFAGSGGTASALVTGKTLTLISPVVGNNWFISGSGVYKTSSRIDFNYSLTIGGNREERFALFTR
jgi:hypothetical protein